MGVSRIPCMYPRNYNSHRDIFGKKLYTITERFDGFKMYLVKEYRRVYAMDKYGVVLPEFPEATAALKMIPVNHLTFECTMVIRDEYARMFPTIHRAGQRIARHHIERWEKLETWNNWQIIVEDISNLRKATWWERMAYICGYVPDEGPIMRTPLLYTGYSVEDVDRWAEWAQETGRAGINIYFHQNRYWPGQTTNCLSYISR